MSPLYLQIMLAYYVTTMPEQFFRPESWRADAFTEARSWMRKEGLIDDDCQATDKLKFYIEHLLSQPLPVPTFKIPTCDK